MDKRKYFEHGVAGEVLTSFLQNLKTTRVGAKLDFHYFGTSLDAVASKLKECIVGGHTYTNTQIKSYL